MAPTLPQRVIIQLHPPSLRPLPQLSEDLQHPSIGLLRIRRIDPGILDEAASGFAKRAWSFVIM